VANTATVASTAYVGPHAKVLGYAVVSDSARIEDYAIVKGGAKISGKAKVNENAMVLSNAEVTDSAVVSGEARVFNGSVISGDAFVTDNAFLDATKVYGNAICCGNLWQRDHTSYEIGGTAVCGGDMEAAGYITSSTKALTSGTYLLEPNSSQNKRSAGDGLGNITARYLKNLKKNWNSIIYRISKFNDSYTGNVDVNSYYRYFDDVSMRIDTINTVVENGRTYRILEQPLEDGDYYIQNPVDGTVLTYNGTSNPVFQTLDATNDTNSVWTLGKLKSGAYKMFNGAANKYLNYLGQLQFYSISYTTFFVFRRSDQQNYAVQNRENKLYWSVSDNTLNITSSDLYEFPVSFVKRSSVPASLIPVAKDNEPIRTDYYTIDGVRHTVPQRGINILKRTYRDGHVESVKVNN
jgi:carbonic anhydrase/acetyltransferase-like protein (isoleucine patch superfamily)